MIATWIAKPGADDRINDLLSQLAAESRREPGCLAYIVHRSAGHRDQFVLYELYRDADALRGHGETAHFKRYVLGEASVLLASRNRVELDVVADGSLFE